MPVVRLSGAARTDIGKILRWSEIDFGKTARSRYRNLIDAALQNLSQNSECTGVQRLADIQPLHCTYHLRYARKRSAAGVKAPRHRIIFKVLDDGDIMIQRVLHERMLISLHLTL